MTAPLIPLKSSSAAATAPPGLRWCIKKNWRWLLGLLGMVMAWHALKGVTWAPVWNLLTSISLLAIMILLAVNLLMLPLMTARWWLLLKYMGEPVGLLSICSYRMAASAISYLTPGPHLGGEPLSVYLLRQHQGTSLSSAATSVAIDRLLELLATFLVLPVCLIALSCAENGAFQGSYGLLFVIVMPTISACVLAALFTGGRPLSRSLLLLAKLWKKSFPSASHATDPLTEIVVHSVARAETLFRRRGSHFLFANLFSLGHWLGIFVEFWLMSFFLGAPLSLSQLTAVVVVARLAFFTPLPAGIGVLETALPWVTATLGLGSSLGLSLCLIIRVRDLLFSFAGLGLTLKYLTYQRKISIINGQTIK